MPQGRPEAGELYRHFKNKDYIIEGIAVHSETKEKMVIYRALYGDYGLYVRPYDMFVSEVDRVKYPDVATKYRFTHIGNAGNGIAEQASATNVRPIESVSEEVPEIQVVSENEEYLGADPVLLQFLDADTTEDKYNILRKNEQDIKEQVLDSMAASLDIVLPDGNMDMKMQKLKNALSLMMRYETTRLR